MYRMYASLLQHVKNASKPLFSGGTSQTVPSPFLKQERNMGASRTISDQTPRPGLRDQRLQLPLRTRLYPKRIPRGRALWLCRNQRSTGDVPDQMAHDAQQGRECNRPIPAQARGTLTRKGRTSSRSTATTHCSARATGRSKRARQYDKTAPARNNCTDVRSHNGGKGAAETR